MRVKAKECMERNVEEEENERERERKNEPLSSW